MTEKLKQTIENELIKSPKEIRDVINDSNWEIISEEIGRNSSLNESEINNLQAEIALFLLGLNYTGSLALDIENNVEVSKEEAEKITKEVENKILVPLYSKLQENIKINLKNKDSNYVQRLNFILSGGNYAAFLERNQEINNV